MSSAKPFTQEGNQKNRQSEADSISKRVENALKTHTGVRPARVIVFDTDKLGASGEHKVKRFIDERTSTAEAKEVLHEAEEHAAEKKEN